MKKPLFTKRAKGLIRRTMMEDAEFGKCKRCQKPFTPPWNDQFETFEVHCSRCQVLNLCDAFESDGPNNNADWLRKMIGEKP